MRKHVTVLSLGAGVQSLAMALMLDAGTLENHKRPDAAIFADTLAEPPWVYQNVETLTALLSYPVITTSYSDIEADTWKTLRREPTIKRPAQTAESIFFDIPTYIGAEAPYRPTTRRCTATYKIEPIRRAIRQHFGWPLTVDQYLGISLDEADRIKSSQVKYITNVYPLVENRLTRNDCLIYLTKSWPQLIPARSSCYFCPFHTSGEWLNIASAAPDLYEKACQLDDSLQQLDPPQHLYSKGDLRSILRNDNLQAKLPLESHGEECSGHCFV